MITCKFVEGVSCFCLFTGLENNLADDGSGGSSFTVKYSYIDDWKVFGHQFFVIDNKLISILIFLD